MLLLLYRTLIGLHKALGGLLSKSIYIMCFKNCSELLTPLDFFFSAATRQVRSSNHRVVENICLSGLIAAADSGNLMLSGFL